ncbi:putative leucine-rich repeat extensin-like protein 7 [Iris pallida]|uniref:Leucine-rich repeat extensin-like protein 7 n=1 Tax=Iris pallida TaxID=29817 RepID=A0AAX6IKA5_IRIPA|nr:putative leucine-rich repeat extensin-like protein 7 [Iris pallida]
MGWWRRHERWRCGPACRRGGPDEARSWPSRGGGGRGDLYGVRDRAGARRCRSGSASRRVAGEVRFISLFLSLLWGGAAGKNWGFDHYGGGGQVGVDVENISGDGVWPKMAVAVLMVIAGVSGQGSVVVGMALGCWHGGEGLLTMMMGLAVGRV